MEKEIYEAAAKIRSAQARIDNILEMFDEKGSVSLDFGNWHVTLNEHEISLIVDMFNREKEKLEEDFKRL